MHSKIVGRCPSCIHKDHPKYRFWKWKYLLGLRYQSTLLLSSISNTNNFQKWNLYYNWSNKKGRCHQYDFVPSPLLEVLLDHKPCYSQMTRGPVARPTRISFNLYRSDYNIRQGSKFYTNIYKSPTRFTYYSEHVTT